MRPDWRSSYPHFVADRASTPGVPIHQVQSSRGGGPKRIHVLTMPTGVINTPGYSGHPLMKYSTTRPRDLSILHPRSKPQLPNPTSVLQAKTPHRLLKHPTPSGHLLITRGIYSRIISLLIYHLRLPPKILSLVSEKESSINSKCLLSA